MSWGLALWLLSYLPRSILHLSLSLNLGGHNPSLDQSFPVFLRRVFQLNFRGGGGIELICIQGKSAQEQPHMIFFHSLVSDCLYTRDVLPNLQEKSIYRTQECSPCPYNPI